LRASRSFLGAVALALASCSPADQGPAEIAVSNGWTREIAPGQSAAAVYLTISNKGGGGDRLVDVRTTRGDSSLHSTESSGGIARMRPLDHLEIAPRSTVELKPGATHIMLTGLARPPRQGETFEVQLVFARSGTRPVPIRVVGAGEDGHSAHGM
jgi:copper(I)-binding protein